jgi:5-methylcytosine-specific restriction endonuclease McrA
MRQYELDRKAKNPEQYRQQKAKHAIDYYYRNHEANKEKNKAKEKQRRANNPQHLRALDKANTKRNREKINARRRLARLNDPQRFRGLDHKRYQEPKYKAIAANRGFIRKAKRFGCVVYKVTWQELVKIYEQPCVYCGTHNLIQIDHIIPLSRKGVHGIGNLQPMCAQHNLSKNNKTMTEWRKMLEINAILASALPYLRSFNH